MTIIITLLAAYLLGSISSAIITCKLLSLPDPRTQGSKNPGATNVARIAGKKIAAIVLLGDALKGFIPTITVHLLFQSPLLTALTALAAFLGHIYPVFFNFQGGKGVATALGGLWGLTWLFGAIFTLSWLIVWKISRLSSLAALIAMTLTTAAVIAMQGFPSSVPIIIMYGILLWRHKENIKRLQNGTEKKI